MNALPPALQQLVTAFSKLPGIGRKTATRLAFHVLGASDDEAADLATSVLDVKKHIHLCSVCRNFTENDPCDICRNPNRNPAIICIVEDAQNLLQIENTNEFRGKYHVLGGVISPLDGIGPEELHIKPLLSRLADVEEIILALNPSTEGEATSIYLSRLLKPQQIRITRLARGIPLGGSLEFVDDLTLSKALQSRHEM